MIDTLVGMDDNNSNEADPLTMPSQPLRTRNELKFVCNRCHRHTRTVVLQENESALTGPQLSNCRTCKGQTIHTVTMEKRTLV